MALVNGNGVDELAAVSSDVIKDVASITNWLEAIGIVFFIWLFFQVVTFFINRKRMKEVYQIRKDIDRIEKKIDRVLMKKK